MPPNKMLLSKNLVNSLRRVTPYFDRDLSQYWLAYWPVVWRHQAITWSNIDLSSVRSPGTYLRALSLIDLTRTISGWNDMESVNMAWHLYKKMVDLPRIPSHITVFSVPFIAIVRRNKTLISFAWITYFIGLNWVGEHSRNTFCCFRSTVMEIPNPSLHTIRSDNIICSTLMEAFVQFFPTGFTLHVQIPVPRKPDGKAGEVK